MVNIVDLKCAGCQDVKFPLKTEEISDYLKLLHPSWSVAGDHHLINTYKFKNFLASLAFVSQVGELAEAEGHHPDLTLSWDQVKVKIYTHKIDGLHLNDFILAAKIDRLALAATRG